MSDLLSFTANEEFPIVTFTVPDARRVSRYVYLPTNIVMHRARESAQSSPRTR